MSSAQRSSNSGSRGGTEQAAASTTTSKLPQRANRLLFRRHLAHLQLRLHPLLSVSNGDPHPAFPCSILQYHLLTEQQLDDLAHWYHQRTPGPHSFNYPAPVIVRWDRTAPLEHKRRRFGRFIGLRGCESPLAEKPGSGSAAGFNIDGYRARVEAQARELRSRFDGLEGAARRAPGPADGARHDAAMDIDMELQDVQSQEEMDRVIEARFRRALEREREREVWRRKGF